MDGPVSLNIYSVSGHRVVSFGNLTGRSGYNQHNWNLLDGDGDMVSSGSYIYVLSSGDSEVTGVAVIVK